MEREDMTNVLIFFMIIIGIVCVAVGVGYVAGMGWSMITFGGCLVVFGLLALSGGQ